MDTDEGIAHIQVIPSVSEIKGKNDDFYNFPTLAQTKTPHPWAC